MHIMSVSTRIATLLLITLTNPVYSAVISYHDQDSFLSALAPETVQTHDFESYSTGSIISSGDTESGITFTYNIGNPSLEMMIASDFNTTSGNQYLGLNDPANFNQFVAGDSFTLSFTQQHYAFGLYLISGDALFTGDVSLSTSAGEVFNSDLADIILNDGGMAYYIGMIADTGFSSVTISFNPLAEGAFLYNIDDISISSTVVPVPAAIWLFVSGIFLIMTITGKKRYSVMIDSGVLHLKWLNEHDQKGVEL